MALNYTVKLRRLSAGKDPSVLNRCTLNQTSRPTCSSTRARTQKHKWPNYFNAITVTHGSVGAEIMTRAKRAADANQMRRSDLKGREGGTRAELDKL